MIKNDANELEELNNSTTDLDNLSRVTINEKNLSDEDLMQAYLQSEHLALIPILKLIYTTIKIDYGKDFKLKIPLSSNNSNKIPINGLIINKNDESNIKYKIYLDIVDKDYDLDNELLNVQLLSNGSQKLINEPNEELKNQLIQIITYLTQSAKIVFDKLKKKYLEILEYHIDIDYNTTIFLDAEIDKRLGIKFQLFNDNSEDYKLLE
jgi:hypothetical protein